MIKKQTKTDKDQEKLFDKLSVAILNLIADGETDLAKRLGSVVNALADGQRVLALIVAKLENIPKKICDTIKETYNIKDVD